MRLALHHAPVGTVLVRPCGCTFRVIRVRVDNVRLQQVSDRAPGCPWNGHRGRNHNLTVSSHDDSRLFDLCEVVSDA